MEPQRDFERLRDAYELAFRGLVQTSNSHGNVEQAAANYRARRDALVDYLLEKREVSAATLTAA